MVESKKKDLNPKGLGRGLAALIDNSNSEVKKVNVDGEEVLYVGVLDIIANPYQPRTHWDQEKLKELSDSIRESGLLQPLIVRPRSPEKITEKLPQKYELIAGERRLRALKLANYERAPVIVKDVDEKTSLEIAIVENIQREDLNPVDEALGYRRLINEFNYSQEHLGKKVGRDRTTVTNSLRLLNLPTKILDDLAEGKISAGHARSLLSLPTDEDRLSLAALIIQRSMSVRETEKMVREARQRVQPKAKKKPDLSPEIRFLEEKLQASLGTKIQIKHRGRRGKIEIEYYSLDDLDRIVQQLGG